MMGTLHEDQYAFISRSMLLRMRNVSDKGQKKIKYFIFINFFRKIAFCKIMWENTIQPHRSQMTT